MINKAIEFATRAHAGQFRKGTSRPYIVHPIEVGDIVSTMTKDEEIISAAVLHDTIEDCEGVSREILAREFSERVAGIVAQESEDKTQDMDGTQVCNDRTYTKCTERSTDGRIGGQVIEYARY